MNFLRYRRPLHLTERQVDDGTRIAFRRSVVVVTVLLWLSNYVVLNGRDYLSERGLTFEVALMRIALMTVGCGLCYLIHLVIRSLSGKPFHYRAIAVAVMTPVAAEAFTWLNTLGFWLVAPERIGAASVGNIIFSVVYSVWFFMAWSAFYLALAYSEEAREQARRAAAIQAHAHAAQLRALRFQINPHFLFNTLNSISALIVDRQPEKAEQMVSRLAAFFRSNLSADPLEDVWLAEEMAAQRLYLGIEQVRFPDLSVQIDLPSELNRALVPSLILQPLVENAVKYGVANSPSPVRIHIRAANAGDWLLVEIDDDGRGSADPANAGTGIGLVNVRERLRQRFGDCCRFEARQMEQGGFRVNLGMPLRLAT